MILERDFFHAGKRNTYGKTIVNKRREAIDKYWFFIGAPVSTPEKQSGIAQDGVLRQENTRDHMLGGTGHE